MSWVFEVPHSGQDSDFPDWQNCVQEKKLSPPSKSSALPPPCGWRDPSHGTQTETRVRGRSPPSPAPTPHPPQFLADEPDWCCRLCRSWLASPRTGEPRGRNTSSGSG